MLRFVLACVFISAALGAPVAPCDPNENLIPVTDVADCSSGFYYVCDHAEWQRMSCESGDVWDADVNACVPLYPGYNCQQKDENQRAMLESACVNQGNSSVVHPFYCGKFIACHNSEFRHVLSCPVDLQFSGKLQRCDYAYNVNCVQSRDIVEVGCVAMAKPNDCNRFVRCDGKLPIDEQCKSPITYYSNTLKVCVWDFQLNAEERRMCGLQ